MSPTAEAPVAAGYQTRILPPEEWPKLLDRTFRETGLPDPNLCTVLVVETPLGEIVGTWIAITAVHLEGLWVDPAHRGTSVASRLLKGMTSILQEAGILASFTLISDPQVAALASKAGFTRYPADTWVLQLPPKAEEPS